MVVVYHRGNGPSRYSIVPLLVEGDTTPGAHHNFSLGPAVQGGKILRRTNAVHVNIGLLPCQGSHGSVAIHRLGIEEKLSPCLQVHARISPVVHRGHGQGVGKGTRHPGGGHAHVPCIQVPGGAVAVVHPSAGISGGHCGHNPAFGEGIQNGLIGLVAVPIEAGAPRAKRQVHCVTPQDNGVFNGRHIVRVVGATGFAEDLHGDDLGVRGHALGLHGLQSRSKGPILLGDVGVCRCNPGHVGAMLRLLVVVMGDIQVPVNVVKTKGQFPAHIQVLCRVILGRHSAANIQLIQNCGNLLRIQQIQLLLIVLQGLPLQLRPASQSILEASAGE